MQFIAGFTTTIAWVWYVLGALTAIVVGLAVLLVAIVILAAGFDVASDVLIELGKGLRKFINDPKYHAGEMVADFWDSILDSVRRVLHGKK